MKRGFRLSDVDSGGCSVLGCGSNLVIEGLVYLGVGKFVVYRRIRLEFGCCVFVLLVCRIYVFRFSFGGFSEDRIVF